jgi:hypothetical protein
VSQQQEPSQRWTWLGLAIALLSVPFIVETFRYFVPAILSNPRPRVRTPPSL